MVLLPEEIWEMIFHRVDGTVDLLQLSLVCKDWYRIIRCDPRFTKHLALRWNLRRPYQQQFLTAFQHLKILELHGDDFPLFNTQNKAIQQLLDQLERVIVHDFSRSKAVKHLVFADNKIRRWSRWHQLFDRIALDPKKSMVDFHLEQVLGFVIPKIGEAMSRELVKMADDLSNMTHLRVVNPFTRLGSSLMDTLASKSDKLETMELHMEFYDDYSNGESHLLSNACHGVKKLKLRNCSLNMLKAKVAGLVDKFTQVTRLEIIFVPWKSDKIGLKKILTTLEILSSTPLNLSQLDLCIIMAFNTQWFPICQTIKQRINEYFSERVFVKISFHLDDFKVQVVKNPYQEPNYYVLNGNKKYFGKSIVLKEPLKRLNRKSTYPYGEYVEYTKYGTLRLPCVNENDELLLPISFQEYLER